MIKKTIFWLLALSIVLSLVACGPKDTESDNSVISKDNKETSSQTNSEESVESSKPEESQASSEESVVESSEEPSESSEPEDSREYATITNIKFDSVASDVKIRDGASLTSLYDGKKLSDTKTFDVAGVVLFQNLKAKEAEPTQASLVLIVELEAAYAINDVIINFYAEHNSYIDLPKDKLVDISVSADGKNFTNHKIIDIDYEMPDFATDNSGRVVEVVCDLGSVPATKYIRIEVGFGADVGDVVGDAAASYGYTTWEWLGMTEIQVPI